MSIFIITNDLLAISDTPRPKRERLTKAEYRDVLKKYEHRNKYRLHESFTDTHDVRDYVGRRVEGELLSGELHVTEIL